MVRRTVGVAVKPGKEPASVRLRCLDKKPRALIPQTKRVRNHRHARRVGSAQARTIGVAVEVGRELDSMRPRCVDRKVRPLSTRTNQMRNRRAVGAAVNTKPMRNRRRGVSVCSECRLTVYGKVLARSVRLRYLDRKPPPPLSPRCLDKRPRALSPRKTLMRNRRHARRVDKAPAQCGQISAFHSAWERSQHEGQSGPNRLDELGRPPAWRLRSLRLRARRRQQYGRRLPAALERLLERLLAALCKGACKRGQLQAWLHEHAA